MKRFFNIFAIALVSVLMFSCQKDADVDNFGLGGTVNGEFQLVIPSNELVEITRATEAEESEVKNVTLFYFDAEGNALKPTELDGKNYEQIVLGNAQTSGNYTRTYTIGTKAKFGKEQVVTVYAIANTDSNLGSVDDFTAPEVAGNHEKFTNLLMSMSSLNESFSTMVMSGSVQATVWNTGLIGTIQVKRPYAKVNFTIKNGNSNFTFTPTQYNVKNVPTCGAVFEGVKAENVKFTNYDDMADFVKNQGAQVIEFYMLENQAGNAEGVKDYYDRELRKDADKNVNDGNKHDEFAHGLANATYVEILGEGKGIMWDEEQGKNVPISATVKYTIHLGDFTVDATDFNVNRNTFYNYTVTVNGVDKIVVEAKSTAMDDEQFQHGAEGTVINLEGSKMVYTLDAHYEQVLLDINPKSILVNGAINPNTPVLFVSTPFMKETAMITWNDLTDPQFNSKYDTKWVEFYRMTETDKGPLREYPGADKTMSTVEFLNDIQEEALKGTESIKVVAYINEYFYDDNPLTGVENIHWSEFVNKEDRVMRILQAPQISADGHSISTRALCAFTQHSIRTFFNENTADAYGMEWYDETGAKSEFSYNGSSEDNGLVNFNARSRYFDIDYASVGYDDYNNGQPNGNVYTKLSMDDAGYVCLARNRSTSDIKWYPAAPNQYVAYWFGEASIPTEAKLYKGDPEINITSAEGWSDGGYNYLYHYFTSGPENKKYLWAIEGASFSPGSWLASAYGVRGKGHHVRCMRNLGAQNNVAKVADPGTINGQNAIAIKNFTESAYRGIATQVLPVHHERDAANKITKAFIVGEPITASWTAMSMSPATPKIISIVTNADRGFTITFLNAGNYAYATNTSSTKLGTTTSIMLGEGNSYTLAGPTASNTYYFVSSNNNNVHSPYITVSKDENGNWVVDNTPKTLEGETTSYGIEAGSGNNNIPMMAAIYQDLCANYGDGKEATAWRVPNQRELLAMYITGLGDVKNLSSTLFSARNLASSSTIRYGYMWYSNASFGLYSYNDTGSVRCVRDATEAEIEAFASNSGDQEVGGEG